MALPKITYDAGAGVVTVNFKRGPRGFACDWAPRAHDNVSSSGAARERVVEGLDMLIGFTMPALVIGDDYAAWRGLMKWAIPGNGFKLYPSSSAGDYYNCVDEMGAWNPKRVARGVLAYEFRFRILLDAQAPSDPGVVMEKFYA